MKAIKLILAVITFTILSGFTNDNKKEIEQIEGYYYFAYASLDKYSEHIYITSILYISKEDCKIASNQGSGENYAITNQYNDYMKAEYKGIIFKCKGNAYNDNTFSKAEAMKSRRRIMEYAKKVTKITDFEYLCD